MRTLTFICAALVLFAGCSAASTGGGDDTTFESADDSAGDDTGGDDTAGDDDTAFSETWADPASGLMWQTTPSEDGIERDPGIAYCENLVLGGFDDWRLPSISELRTLVRGCAGTAPGGSCNVTDDCLDVSGSCWIGDCGCEVGSGPTNGCYGPSEMPFECGKFLSASMPSDQGYGVWGLFFDAGGPAPIDDSAPYLAARCVRG